MRNYEQAPYSDEIWSQVRAMWEAGNSAGSISRKSGMPSKQSICVRAKSEAWERVDEHDAELDVIPFDGLSIEQQVVVKEMARGLPQKWAAAVAGVAEVTVSRWKTEHVDFAKAVQAATGVFVRRQLSKVVESQDWRSGLAMIERHPATRGEFSPPNVQRGMMVGPTFNVLGQVQVGIQRGDYGLPEIGHESAVIDAGGLSDESEGMVAERG